LLNRYRGAVAARGAVAELTCGHDVRLLDVAYKLFLDAGLSAPANFSTTACRILSGYPPVPLANDMFDRELATEVEVKTAVLPASAELTDAAGPHVGGSSIPEQRL
jgi:hypothetical protein